MAQSHELPSWNPNIENRQDPSLRTTDILNIARSIWPDRSAIKFGDKSTTYEELYSSATKIAHGLLTNNINRGDSIAVLSGNSPEYIQTYFASALIGANFVPLNFRSTPEQIAYMLNTVNAKALFYPDRNRSSAQAIKDNIDSNIKRVAYESNLDGEIPFKDLADHNNVDEIDTSGNKDTDITVVMFTSGTTSLPKAVEQPHRSFTKALSFTDDPDRHEAILITTPLFHVAGLQGIFASIVEGRTMVLLPDFKPESFLQAFANGVRRATLVPTQIEQIINHGDFDKYDLSPLQQITYGGSHMPLQVIRKATEKLPDVSFTRAYGLTETGGTVAVMGPEDHKITGKETKEELQKKLYALTYGIGKPIDGVRITVVDDLGNEIPSRDDENSGELGKIVVETDRIMQGYRGRQEETKKVLHENKFITSDLGWIDREGNVYCVGRADDMIIRGGEKIPPAEIETALLNHPAIAEVGAIGVSDKEWGQVIGVAIVLKPGSNATKEQIIAFCKEILGSSKVPAKIVFTEKLPRNAMEKLVRKDLNPLFETP